MPQIVLDDTALRTLEEAYLDIEQPPSYGSLGWVYFSLCSAIGAAEVAQRQAVDLGVMRTAHRLASLINRLIRERDSFGALLLARDKDLS